MQLDDIRAKVTEQRQTGRHRAEPKYRLGPLIVIATVISLTCTAIVTVFLVQGHPEPLAPMQYRPSSPAVIPQPVVFPPLKRETSQSRTYTVKTGDTLWDIARKECGNGLAWDRLQHENSINPWWLGQGQVLKISC